MPVLCCTGPGTSSLVGGGGAKRKLAKKAEKWRERTRKGTKRKLANEAEKCKNDREKGQEEEKATQKITNRISPDTFTTTTTSQI